MARHVESINVGTKQDNFYAQLGAVYSKQDHFKLSNDYDANMNQPDGDRLRSEAQDKKISLNAGYVANDNSEIAVSYANQKAVKQQPPATDLNYSQLKYWDWPIWDKETLSVTGQKNFENSYLKAAANYKKNVHEGYDLNKVTDTKTLTETYEDHTTTLGIEDSYKITSQWELLGGVSYDTRTADKIFDTNTANLNMLALETQSSLSPQAALIYSPDESSKVRESVSRKTYMPSMKDRYSRKFGTSVPNVDLKNELLTHYELSYQKKINAFVSRTNLFYTKVDDAIQAVSWDQNASLLQNKNVGTFDHKGIEFELSYKHEGLKVVCTLLTIEIDEALIYLKQKNISVENKEDSLQKISEDNSYDSLKIFAMVVENHMKKLKQQEIECF
ncbi:MAG: TonB-dependent receptor [Campylobacterales bacterium]|nr:TonB-dependent receptor [Campylobacterales bacterium]